MVRPERSPAGYIRRSSADAKNPGQFSESVQMDAIRALATLDGHDPDTVEWYRDWNMSGGRTDRPDYQRLLADVEAERISHVYALNLSRIGRSLKELIDFERHCREHGTALHLAKDPVDTSTASGRMLYAILASVAQFVRDLAMEGQQANLDERRERGDKMGQANYGMKLVQDDEGRYLEERDESVDIEPLREALEDAGSVIGAVRLLNERGIQSPRGKIWHQSAYRRALTYHFPGLLTEQVRSHANTRSSMYLSGLLRCHCGRTLTPNQARGQFYCYGARLDPEGHGGHKLGNKPKSRWERKSAVKESELLPWVREEAARLRIPIAEVRMAAERETERDKLYDRLENLSRQHEMGVLTDDELAARVGDIRADLERLAAEAAVVSVPPSLDWDWSVEAVNRWLRAAFARIELGSDLRPVRALWRVPEWRAD